MNDREAVERFLAFVRDHRWKRDSESFGYLGMDDARAIARVLEKAGFKERVEP